MFSRGVLDHLEKSCPEAVMVRAALENALPPEIVDQVFHENSNRQYQRTLLFSTIVQLLGLVVCRVRPSLHAAFQLCAEHVGTTVRAVYDKLNKTEPAISMALVHRAYERMSAVVNKLKAKRPPLVAGYRTRLIDGNHLEATERRLTPLRQISSGPLPGVAVVVFDRELELIESVDVAEDAYTQERRIVIETVGRAQANDLWIADRNFCTAGVLWQLDAVDAAFVIRRHSVNVRYQSKGRMQKLGQTETGTVHQQAILIEDDFGGTMPARLVRVTLDNPTRDGDRHIDLLTNLPRHVSGLRVAEAYRTRWDIEVTFAEIRKLLSGEIGSLGHPRAALLAFCLALIAYNALSMIKSAMRATHGTKKIDEDVSLYYVAHKVQSEWRALEVFADVNDWIARFSRLTPIQLAKYLKHVSQQLNLARLKKHKRGPKKPQPPRIHNPRKPHVATCRLLELKT